MHRENRGNDFLKVPIGESTGTLEVLPKHKEKHWEFVLLQLLIT